MFDGLEYKLLNKGASTEYTGMEYDSRKIKEGNVFFALVGSVVDGHDYIEKAIEKGAKMIVVSEDVPILDRDVTYVKVEDVRQVMGLVAANYYGHPEKNVKIIGITGTNGKTTTTYILEKLLGRVSRIGTVEYKVGDEVFPAPNTTPESLDLVKILSLTVEKEIEYLIMEVSSHALEMGRVEMVDFDAAIFTNLSQDHLDYHKDMEGYFGAKKKLFEKLKDKSKGVYNIDDVHGKRLFEEFGGISYGKEALLQGEIIDHTLKDMEIKLAYNGVEKKEKVRLMGMFNLYNIMGAIGGVIQLGYNFDEICDKLTLLEGVPGRFQNVEAGQDYMVVVDYAHTPDGLRNILEALTDIKKNRIITVFGAGGDRDKTKRPLMAKVASELSDYVVVTSDNPRTEDPAAILKDVEAGIKGTGTDYIAVIDRREAIGRAIEIAEKDDIVLLAGKGHEDYQIIGREKIHFDDREIAREFIENSK